jgi:hypothetical protein
LRALGIDDSIVLRAEDVQRDAAGVMRLFWQALGLDYRPAALDWAQSAPPEDWQYVSGWHQSVSASKGIKNLSRSDEQARASEFERLCEQAPQLRDYLQHHLPYYRKLCAYSLTDSRHAD